MTAVKGPIRRRRRHLGGLVTALDEAQVESPKPSGELFLFEADSSAASSRTVSERNGQRW